MRTKFDEQLTLLNHELIHMGAMCEEGIALAEKSLTTGDMELAARIAPLSEELNHMERTVENLCMRLLLQQQPVAGDLRHISAALKMITDMDRIGTQAEDIAEIVQCMKKDLAQRLPLLDEMARATIHMVTGSVDAFVEQDINLAKKVIDGDDEVDAYFDQVRTALVSLIAENPARGEDVLDLLMIAKYFERIGDHAVNIAEWVVYSVTGLHKGEHS